jgi:hypothetical protein
MHHLFFDSLPYVMSCLHMLMGEPVGGYPLWVNIVAGSTSVQISNPGVWSFVDWLL